MKLGDVLERIEHRRRLAADRADPRSRSIVDLIIPAAIAKWALLAPIFIPLFIRLGVAPQTVLAAYRVGDSPFNVITPLMAYFPLIVVFTQRYKKDAGIGTVVSLMLPVRRHPVRRLDAVLRRLVPDRDPARPRLAGAHARRSVGKPANATRASDEDVVAIEGRAVSIARLPRSRLAAVVPAAPTASADLADETALAERYAPVVRLVAHAQELRRRASRTSRSTSTLLFGEPTVALRGPVGRRRPRQDRARRRRISRPASTSTTSTSPATRSTRAATTCDWAAAPRPTGRAPTVYAHVVDRPGASRASSRSSTGSSTSSTTGTTCTRATGR